MKGLIVFLLAILFSNGIFAQRYLFYLHGKIIEDQGAHAIDTVHGYGAYQYDEILNAFRKANFTVMSEVRRKNANPFEYAHRIEKQVDSLIRKGVKPDNITIVGASKGAIISMFISSYLKNKDVNFVFMGGCDDEILKAFPQIQFCGNILSIYEKTDEEGSCAGFKKSSKLTVPHYREIELNTGLKHGYLYKALPEWMEPAIQWANKNYQ
jgi:hypothetical protein